MACRANLYILKGNPYPSIILFKKSYTYNAAANF